MFLFKDHLGMWALTSWQCVVTLLYEYDSELRNLKTLVLSQQTKLLVEDENFFPSEKTDKQKRKNKSILLVNENYSL